MIRKYVYMNFNKLLQYFTPSYTIEPASYIKKVCYKYHVNTVGFHANHDRGDLCGVKEGQEVKTRGPEYHVIRSVA